jgi:integrase
MEKEKEKETERGLKGAGHLFLKKDCRFYYAQFYGLDGKIVCFSTRETTESKARLVLNKRMGLSSAGVAVGTVLERTMWAELIDDVEKNYKVKELRSLDRAKSCAVHLTEFFGEKRKAKTLSSPLFDEYSLARQKEGAANGTINRELAMLRRALSLGKRNGKIANPPSVTMLPAGGPRQGFVTQAEFLKLLAALPDDGLRDAVAFLYYSGWRVGEMKSLQWADIDRVGKRIVLRPENSKNKEGRSIPAGPDIWPIIERAATRQVPKVAEVFHRDGRKITAFRQSWVNARDAAGLPKLMVHDLRRSAIRNLVRSGVSEGVAMKISGHKTRSVFERYNVTSEADIAAAMEKQSAWLAAQPTKIADIIPFRATA